MIATAAGAWYVYGVADGAGPDLERKLSQLRGFGPESELRLVGIDGLAAIVGSVSLDEFGEDALPRRLNDRAWLEEKARAHEDVLQSAAAATAVVPLRFGTIYRELDDVTQLLRARRDELEAALEHVRGRVELGVKAWVDRAELEQSLAGGDSAAAARAESGRGYLERRQTERERSARAAALIAEVVPAAHERLAAHAIAAVANRPQPRELTGRDDAMILNAAYLVPDDDASLIHEVDALGETYRHCGITFEVTGPWPPHNFVDVDMGAR